jgi:hypothetical protein
MPQRHPIDRLSASYAYKSTQNILPWLANYLKG